MDQKEGRDPISDEVMVNLLPPPNAEKGPAAQQPQQREEASPDCLQPNHSMTFTGVLHIAALFLMQGKPCMLSCTISLLQAAQPGEPDFQSSLAQVQASVAGVIS